MKSFHELSLPTQLVQALEHLHITEPTPIQAQAIPVVLEGRDLLASAQTGTGKTLAYLLPLLVHLTNSDQGIALILAPTRELAMQVRDTLPRLLGKNPPINLALLIGGDSMGKQCQDLRRRPRLVVGTPGRVADHLRRGSLRLSEAHFLVLDEIDRMLDLGFSKQLEEIAKYLPKQRQTLMFSATLPRPIEKLAEMYLKDFIRIAVGSTIEAPSQIKQNIIHLPAREKYARLGQELEQREGSIIIFVKTKRSAEQMAGKLEDTGHSADAIHGDLRQQKRERVVQAFRQRRTRILVATDVAARGLDVPHIEHVINYDLPMCPEDYIHRIGRTGRASGVKGEAISFVSPEDTRLWRAIHRLMHPGEAAPKEHGLSQPKERGRGRGNASSRGSKAPAFRSKDEGRPFSRQSNSRASYDPLPKETDSRGEQPASRRSKPPFSSTRSRDFGKQDERVGGRRFEAEGQFDAKPAHARSRASYDSSPKEMNSRGDQPSSHRSKPPFSSPRSKDFGKPGERVGGRRFEAEGQFDAKPAHAQKPKRAKKRNENFVSHLLAEDQALRDRKPSSPPRNKTGANFSKDFPKNKEHGNGDKPLKRKQAHANNKNPIGALAGN